MSRGNQSTDVVPLSAYEVHLRAGELFPQGRKIKLQVQPFHVLTMLLERPGEVVAREELQKRLWRADTFVDFDHSLNTAIKKLRQALSDDGKKPRFIETLPKRGYRFTGKWSSQRSCPGARPCARALKVTPDRGDRGYRSKPDQSQTMFSVGTIVGLQAEKNIWRVELPKNAEPPPREDRKPTKR